MESLRPIEPLRIMCLDGQERSFLRSMGAVQRIYRRQSATLRADKDKDPNDIDQSDREIEAIAVALWECMLDKGTLSEADFKELLPGDIVWLQQAAKELMSISEPPKVDTEDPTLARAPNDLAISATP